MRKAIFNVSCVATYQSSLEIPNDVKEEEIIDYIQEHLDETDIETELEWMNDFNTDAVTEDDIIEVIEA